MIDAPSPVCCVYVYYQVAKEACDAAHAAIVALQLDIARLGYATELLRRPQADAEGRQTWMEVYLDVPRGFDEQLDRMATWHAVAEQLASPRHNEIFVRMPDAASVSTCA